MYRVPLYALRTRPWFNFAFGTRRKSQEMPTIHIQGPPPSPKHPFSASFSHPAVTTGNNHKKKFRQHPECLHRRAVGRGIRSLLLLGLHAVKPTAAAPRQALPTPLQMPLLARPERRNLHPALSSLPRRLRTVAIRRPPRLCASRATPRAQSRKLVPHPVRLCASRLILRAPMATRRRVPLT